MTRHCSVLFCVAVLFAHPYRTFQYGHGSGSGSVSGSFSSSGSSSSASSFASASSYASSGSYNKPDGVANDIAGSTLGFLNQLEKLVSPGAYSVAGSGATAGTYSGTKGGVKGSAILKKHGLGVGGGVGIANGDSLVGTGDFGSAAIKANCGQNACSYLGTGHLPLEHGPAALENGGLGAYADNDNFKIGPHKPSGYGAKTNSGAGVGGGIGIGPSDTFLGGGVKQNNQGCGSSGCGGGVNQQPGIKPVIESEVPSGGITCSGLACLQIPKRPSQPCGSGGCNPDAITFPGAIGGYGSAGSSSAAGSFSGSSSSPGFAGGSVVISKPGHPDTSIHFGDVSPSYQKPGYNQQGPSTAPGTTPYHPNQSSSSLPTYNQQGPSTSGGCGTAGCSNGQPSDILPNKPYSPNYNKPGQPGSTTPEFGADGTPVNKQNYPSGLSGSTSPDFGPNKPGYSQSPGSPPLTSPGAPYNQQQPSGCGPNGCASTPNVGVPGNNYNPQQPSKYPSSNIPSAGAAGSYKPQYPQLGTPTCGPNGAGCSGSQPSNGQKPSKYPTSNIPSVGAAGSYQPQYPQQGTPTCGPNGAGCSGSQPIKGSEGAVPPICGQNGLGCTWPPTDCGATGCSSTPNIPTGAGSYSPSCGTNGVGCGPSNIPKDVYPKPGEHKPSTELEAPYPTYKPVHHAISPTPNIIPDEGFHYTGPFPGPQGSIHNSKPTRRPSGPTTSLPSVVHGPEVTSLRPNYDVGPSPSGPEDKPGFHYTGPFPGRPGSIHDSKPAGPKPVQPGTTPNTQYPTQPSPSKPGYGGTPNQQYPNQQGSVPAPNAPGYGGTPSQQYPNQPGVKPTPAQHPTQPSLNNGFHYTGPFPGPTGPIDKSKPATGIKPIPQTGPSAHAGATADSGINYPKPTVPTSPSTSIESDAGLHYAGPFPGPSGSIHESKPASTKTGAHAGTSAGTPYTPQQPTAQTYPGSSSDATAYAGSSATAAAPYTPQQPTAPSSTAGASTTSGSTAYAGTSGTSQQSTAPSHPVTPSHPEKHGKPGKPGYGPKSDADSPIIRVIPTPSTKPQSKPDVSSGVSDEFGAPSKPKPCSSGNCDVNADVGQGCGGSGCGTQPDTSVGVSDEFGSPSKGTPCASGNCDVKADVGQGCGGSGCAIQPGGSPSASAGAFAGAGAYSSSGAFGSSGSHGFPATGGHGGTGCASCSGLQSLLNGFGSSFSGTSSYSGSKGGSKSSAYSSSGSGAFGFGGAHAGSFASSYASSGAHAGHY